MKFQGTAPAFALAALGLAAGAAQAASENILVDNGSIATAQGLEPLSGEGVLNVSGVRGSVVLFDALIEDNNDADFYSFSVGANKVLTLRVDTPEGPLNLNDPVVGLYTADGTLVAKDDDGGPGYDSLLSYTISNPGTYYAAVSGYDDFDFDGVADIFEDEGSGSGIPSTNFLYNLQISAAAGPTTPVPAPAAAWLLGSALLGLARRRKAA